MLRSVSWIVGGVMLCCALAFPIISASAQSPKTKETPNAKGAKGKAPSKVVAEEETVEFFEAINDGRIAVDFIPHDSAQANMIFRNKSDKPLRIKLPETFGAVPVLAQQGMPGGGFGGGGQGGGMGQGGMGGGMGGGGGGGQGVGGGMGGMGGGMMGGMGGGGMGGGGMGGGMFRVEPDKPRKLEVQTVCLEHGKLDPTPRMKYKVVQLEEVNADSKVSELCRMLGYQKVNQNTAQAIAWHIANGLSWQQLVNKPKVISKYTGIELYFSPSEIQAAMRLTNQITQETESSNSDSRSRSTSDARPISDVRTVSVGS